MKLKNRVRVQNTNRAIALSYSFLGALLLGVLALVYFNIKSTNLSAANIAPGEGVVKRTANDFRVLQNGKPIDPLMGISVNADGNFEIQIRPGVDLKKTKTKPIGSEISILRGGTKISTKSFADINEVKTQNLGEWIKSNYQPKDKLAIELLNTTLEPSDAVKVYSMAAVY
jgi:DNA-binding transcriptional regulator YiaG